MSRNWRNRMETNPARVRILGTWRKTYEEKKIDCGTALCCSCCFDTVMDAARSAKAGGGTVIHAKGTGMEFAKKYLGVSLVEEKEVILIVTKSREKNQIMKAIMEQAGLDSKERTIVFSLPVTSVAGIRMLEEDIQDDLL